WLAPHRALHLSTGPRFSVATTASQPDPIKRPPGALGWPGRARGRPRCPDALAGYCWPWKWHARSRPGTRSRSAPRRRPGEPVALGCGGGSSLPGVGLLPPHRAQQSPGDPAGRPVRGRLPGPLVRATLRLVSVPAADGGGAWRAVAVKITNEVLEGYL